MPFKNRVANINGVLVLPSLRSPDFAYTATPGAYSIDGWSLSTDPSILYAQTVYTEGVRIPSDITGRYVDLSVLETTRRNWEDNDFTLMPASFACPVALSPTGLSINIPWAQNPIGVTPFDVNPTPLAGSSGTMTVFIEAVGYFSGVTAANLARIALQVTPYVGVTPGAPVTLTGVGSYTFTAAGQQGSTSQIWKIGSFGSYNPAANVTELTVEMLGASSVAGAATLQAAQSRLWNSTKVRVNYTG